MEGIVLTVTPVARIIKEVMDVVPSQMRRAAVMERTVAQLVTHARTMGHVSLTCSGECIVETMNTAQIGTPVARETMVGTDAIL